METITLNVPSKILELNQNAPKWAKKMPKETLLWLFQILESFVTRFCYGMQGFRGTTMNVQL
jgi:hypothetical protein